MELDEIYEKCQQLQKKIKLAEYNNLDEDEIIKLRKEYDFYYKLLVKHGEKKHGKI